MRTPRRVLLATLICALSLVVGGCTPATSDPTPPAPSASSASAAVDGVALETDLEKVIAATASLDRIRAVLVTVDGKPVTSHYRGDFGPEDHRHVWGVTSSVTSALVGIAVEDGLIASVDAPLEELLPDRVDAMTAPRRKATLRQLMTMSAGFAEYWTWDLARRVREQRGDFGDALLERPPRGDPGSVFQYSNASAHLVAVVLSDALRRANRPETLLEYARAELFDPLGIDTEPAFTGFAADPFASKDFDRAGFAWMSDPNGIPYGAFGLRLTAPDLIRIGELYVNGGVHQGRRILTEAWVRETGSPSARSEKYGLLWNIEDGARSGTFTYAQGSYGQFVIVAPARRAVVAIVSETLPKEVREPDDMLPVLELLRDRLT